MNRSVRIIMQTVSCTWPFDSKHYPKLDRATSAEVRDFGFLHMTLHLTKEAGTLARIIERGGHRSGRLPKREWVRAKRLAMKVIVSGFRLFILAGGRAEELIAYMRRS